MIDVRVAVVIVASVASCAVADPSGAGPDPGAAPGDDAIELVTPPIQGAPSLASLPVTEWPRTADGRFDSEARVTTLASLLRPGWVKIVVVEHWWCGPCKTLITHLAEDGPPDADLIVLGLREPEDDSIENYRTQLALADGRGWFATFEDGAEPLFQRFGAFAPGVTDTTPMVLVLDRGDVVRGLAHPVAAATGGRRDLTPTMVAKMSAWTRGQVAAIYERERQPIASLPRSAPSVAPTFATIAASTASRPTPDGPAVTAQPDPRGDAKPDQRGDAKPDQRGDAKPDQRGDAKPDQRTDAKPGKRADARPDRRTDARPGKRTDAKPGKRADARPDKRTDARPGKRAGAKPDQRPADPKAGKIDTGADGNGSGGRGLKIADPWDEAAIDLR